MARDEIVVVDVESEKVFACANDGDRRAKLCRCGVCGVVQRCLPSFDFYGRGADPLTCERCFRDLLNARGIKTLPVDGFPELPRG